MNLPLPVFSALGAAVIAAGLAAPAQAVPIGPRDTARIDFDLTALATTGTYTSLTYSFDFGLRGGPASDLFDLGESFSAQWFAPNGAALSPVAVTTNTYGTSLSGITTTAGLSTPLSGEVGYGIITGLTGEFTLIQAFVLLNDDTFGNTGTFVKSAITPVAAIPLPPALAFLATALAGLWVARRRGAHPAAA